MKKVLAINSGSSSFKYKLFALPEEKVLAEGIADRVGIEGSSFEIKLSNGEKHSEEVTIPDQETAVNLLLKALKEYKVVEDLSEIVGVGHRIVAGGEEFTDSAIIDEEKLQKIYGLKEYAPLHNPAEGKGIEAFMKLLPGVPEIGVFDTSFHQTLDPEHYIYSIPYKYYEKYGVRKYGAHGTSVRYIMGRAAEMLSKEAKDLKLIVCHLGSGASVTAVKNGKSYDTSMGFTPLAGVTMGTRSGDVDPSVLQYIMNKENIDINEMIKILNDQSGLLGISEISSDMRDLENNSSSRASLARDIFVNRVRQYVGSYIVEMEGVDAIIFTAGVGEHDAGVREKIMQSFEFMGLEPDYEANKVNGEKFISKANSKIKAMIIPTDEELMIERDVVRLAHLN
ncbi:MULTISPECIES: acetate/propionate family kinase [unclassified Lactobacillus]|uniref:acetate/propionate family kinase n=1 Tax=unclassified Lactobacillus TaxID=2620435 RepID=UPI000EFD6C4E|nr:MULTISPECIES: acetate kinase [unclassified Lactobacillus]RMC25029.1 acetate kinase [Lactobacillus sp. ESL0247]RMC29184.1 acetate kinase [Lactobacillus sp. ESL0246]RMC32787.1 acetate kinase [Lactobacillus sp. ESL0245]RMC49727.1 acetate kinase [Lactobacillus sp. ESL0228]